VDGEIIARVDRRRQWTPEEKAALLAEMEASGGQVSVVARRHGISKSLLYNWRSTWKAAARGGPGLDRDAANTGGIYPARRRRGPIGRDFGDAQGGRPGLGAGH
jgi:transposase-like protein